MCEYYLYPLFLPYFLENHFDQWQGQDGTIFCYPVESRVGEMGDESLALFSYKIVSKNHKLAVFNNIWILDVIRWFNICSDRLMHLLCLHLIFNLDSCLASPRYDHQPQYFELGLVWSGQRGVVGVLLDGFQECCLIILYAFSHHILRNWRITSCILADEFQWTP